MIPSGIYELTQPLRMNTSVRAVGICNGINCNPVTTVGAEAADRPQQSTILSCGEKVYCSKEYEMMMMIIIIIR
jgi:hypothetical protein